MTPVTGPYVGPSNPIRAKAARQHDENGRPYHSFRGLLEHLATLTRNHVRFGGTGTEIPVLAEPTSVQRQAFDLIDAPIPIAIKQPEQPPALGGETAGQRRTRLPDFSELRLKLLDVFELAVGDCGWVAGG